jgi:hypothetical protein
MQFGGEACSWAEQRWRRSFRFIGYHWAKGKAVISIETIQGNRVQAVALELIFKKIRRNRARK